MILRLPRGEILVDGAHHARGEFLGTQPVATADDASGPGKRGATLGEGGEHIEEKRLANGPRLLGAIQGGNRLHRLGQRGEEALDVEGKEKPDGDDADFLTLRDQPVDGLGDRFDRAAHGDHDAFRLGMTMVLEKLIATSARGREAVHRGLHNAGQGFVEAIDRFPTLKVDVGVLGGAVE